MRFPRYSIAERYEKEKMFSFFNKKFKKFGGEKKKKLLTERKRSAILCKAICFTELLGSRITFEKNMKISYLLDFYGEALDERELERADRYTNAADLMIAAGSSLTVYPAAAYVKYFTGRLVIINYTETDCDASAELLYRDSVSKVLSEAVKILKM